MKETQGTVQITSYGLMNDIFQYGCYFIGSEEPQIYHHYDEVITLSLQEKEGDKRLTKKTYSLEELRDLESKLVLITGSMSEYRKDVDIFIDVSA